MQTAMRYMARILYTPRIHNPKSGLFHQWNIFGSEIKRPICLGQFLRELIGLTPWHIMAIIEFNVDGMNPERLFGLFRVFLIFQFRQHTAWCKNGIANTVTWVWLQEIIFQRWCVTDAGCRWLECPTADTSHWSNEMFSNSWKYSSRNIWHKLVVQQI